MLTAEQEGFGLLSGDDESSDTTPRSLDGCCDGQTRFWPCHCCNRLNDKMIENCRTCGRSAAYVPAMHLPLFGTMAKALRREQAVFLLDQQGFDVNATDSENWTPTHLASKYGNIELLEVLVDRGARLEARTKRGWKPLHFAAQGGHLDCVELLLRKKARVTDVTKDCHSTPLHVSADVGFVGVCRRLLEEEVDLESRDVMERTALHLAADKGHLEVVKALLENGANADVLDHDNWSPRQSAEFRGFMEIAAVLAKGYSNTKEGESATQGASAALPPALWHTAIFAQVRRSAARQRKLEAIAAAREEAYAKYANIYKDHAAERYARAIEASRQETGGLEAYRHRVVAASADAQRYRGYVATTAKGEDEEEGKEGGRDLGLLLEDGGSRSSDASAYSSNNAEGSGSGAGLAQGESSARSDLSLPTIREPPGNSFSKLGAPTTVGNGRGGGAADDEATEVGAGDGAAPEGSEALASGGGGSAEGVLVAPAATRKGRGGGDGGGCGYFADVVPFNNIRAKYLRPLDDVELSRPYHVAPRPGWRAGSAAGSGAWNSSVGGSSTPGQRKDEWTPTASSEITMEAYNHRTKPRDGVTHRRREKGLSSKERRAWGAH